MQSFSIKSAKPPAGTDHPRHSSLFGMTVFPSCSRCQGPLLLAAYIPPARGNPPQRIYSCEVCDRLEWIETIAAEQAR